MLATLAVNDALLCPAPTATLAGTVILPLLLDNVTVAPEGAAAVRLTVQLDVPGAFTVAGEQLKLEGCAVTVSATVVVWLIPFKDAVTVTVWALATVPVVAAKVALLWLAPMVTLAGTVNDPLLLPKVTTAAMGVLLFKMTVQVLDPLLPKLEGEHDTDVSCAGAFAVSVNVCDPPFREAVNNAV